MHADDEEPSRLVMHAREFFVESLGAFEMVQRGSERPTTQRCSIDVTRTCCGNSRTS